MKPYHLLLQTYVEYRIKLKRPGIIVDDFGPCFKNVIESMKSVDQPNMLSVLMGPFVKAKVSIAIDDSKELLL